MFKNYSETYAAAITTFAPLVVLLLGRFGVDVLESDVVLVLGTLISAGGFVWQLIARFKQGGVTPLGKRV